MSIQNRFATEEYVDTSISNLVDSELSLESEKAIQNKVVAKQFNRLSEEIAELQSVLSGGSENVFNPLENTVDTALNQAFILSSGAIRNNGSGSDEGYFVTGKLSIEPNTKYTIKPNIWIEAVPSINRGRCYSSNDTALTALEWVKDNDGYYTFVSPANTAYVRFSVHKEIIGINNGANFEDIIALFNNIFSITVGSGGSGTVSLIPDGSIKEHKLSEELVDKINKRYLLKDKTIVNFGDSVFGNARPPEDVSTFLANLTGATVHNCAFGGCRMAQHVGHWDAFSMYRLADAIATGDYSLQDDALNYDDRTSYAEVPLALLKSIDFNTVDVVTIAYGTNDWNGSGKLDNANNLYDTVYFGGALRYSIERLLNVYPNLKIFILCPTYRFWMDENGEFVEDSDTKTSNSHTLLEYVELSKAIAKNYHIPFIDNYYELGINKFNRSYYFPTTDGTHHNKNGRVLLAEHITKELF